MDQLLAGRAILVTGGGSGIGKGIATAAAARGANVMIAGRDEARLSAAAEEIRSQPGVAAYAVQHRATNITDEDDVARLVEKVTTEFGALDGAVQSAGGSETIGPITQIDTAAWHRTVDLNINGTMYVLKHAAAAMVKGGGGSFVGISSIASTNTHRWFGAYGPSKGALDHLMKLAADELGPSLVRSTEYGRVLFAPRWSPPSSICPRPRTTTALAHRSLGSARSKTSQTWRSSC